MAIDTDIKPIIHAAGTTVMFNMAELNACYDKYGTEGYRQRIAKQEGMLEKGTHFDAFHWTTEEQKYHRLQIFSQNDSLTALPVVRSLDYYGLVPGPMVFTNGRDPSPFLKASGVDMFYTTNEKHRDASIARGVSAALYPVSEDPNIEIDFIPEQTDEKPSYEGEAVIDWVFDCDGVLFDGESEAVYQKHGLQAFNQHEKDKMKEPMKPGPLFDLFAKLCEQNNLYAGDKGPNNINILTARGGYGAVRLIEIFNHHGLHANGYVICANAGNKRPFLDEFRSLYPGAGTRFFDDGDGHVKAGRHSKIFTGGILREDYEI